MGVCRLMASRTAVQRAQLIKAQLDLRYVPVYELTWGMRATCKAQIRLLLDSRQVFRVDFKPRICVAYHVELCSDLC
jgi:hypothetical protein